VAALRIARRVLFERPSEAQEPLTRLLGVARGPSGFLRAGNASREAWLATALQRPFSWPSTESTRSGSCHVLGADVQGHHVHGHSATANLETSCLGVGRAPLGIVREKSVGSMSSQRRSGMVQPSSPLGGSSVFFS
jgi:hypothetical protein